MVKYKIEIINEINNEKFSQLEELIRDFAINLYMQSKANLYSDLRLNKNKIIKDYKSILSKKELQCLNQDISERIEFARQSILNGYNNEKITRYYVLLNNNELIGFQTAQVRKSGDNLEGWRNFAYIKPEYAGKRGTVLNLLNQEKDGFLMNVVYEEISRWFQECGVTKEKTATGKTMYKNLLIYIVKKGFVPEKEDEERVYLVKDYCKKITKKQLKQLYSQYVKNHSNYN